MNVRSLDHLNLTVRDLAETADWYRRVFGFAEVERGVYQGAPWAILRSGDALLCVYEAPKAGDPGAETGHHRVSHFGLRITDRASWEATVAREGVAVQYGGAVRWPRSTSWYVADPTGYEIEVALWDGDAVAFSA